ncbi:MAG: PKD domain-containing protein [Saprospiraceae bacterium]
MVFRDSLISDFENIQYLFASSGVYNIGLEVVDKYFCSDFDSVNVYIFDNPKIYNIDDVKLCYGDTLSLDINQYVDSVLWYDGNTDKIRFFDDVGEYSYTVINDVGCINSDTFSLDYFSIPDTFYFDKSICKNDVFDFFGKNYSQPGRYIDTIRSVYGCDSAYNVLDLNYFPDISADFIIDNPQLCLGDSVFLHSLSNNQDSLNFFWDFGDNEFSDSKEVFRGYSESGEFVIILKVQDVFGCVDSLQKLAYVSPFLKFYL